MTDPIADLLTRIRNALMRGKKNVNVPYSKLKHELVKALVKEGFLEGVKKVKKEPFKKDRNPNYPYSSL